MLAQVCDYPLAKEQESLVQGVKTRHNACTHCTWNTKVPVHWAEPNVTPDFLCILLKSFLNRMHISSVFLRSDKSARALSWSNESAKEFSRRTALQICHVVKTLGQICHLTKTLGRIHHVVKMLTTCKRLLNSAEAQHLSTWRKTFTCPRPSNSHTFFKLPPFISAYEAQLLIQIPKQIWNHYNTSLIWILQL
jgi:hypothetical protein